MTQTNTDYLLQITAAATDRTYGAPAANDGGGKFDDHLSQAATFSGSDSLNRSNSQRTETARYDRDDRSWNSSASKQDKQDSGASTSSRSSPPVQEESADAVTGSTSPAEKPDREEHKTNESDDTTAAEVAGTSQMASRDSTKTDTKTESKTDSDAAVTAKAAAAGKKSTFQASGLKPTGNEDGQTSRAPSPDVTQHADGATKLAVNTAADRDKTSEEVDESQVTASEGKRAKAAKSDASTAKSNKGDSANNEGAGGNHLSADGAGPEQSSSQVAQKGTGNMEASLTLAGATTTKSKSGADESADDDSSTDSHNDTRLGARNDVSVQSTKVDAAQLAGGIPGTTDAGANTPAKGKDNEQSTKPIAAKGEPAAAAFARMARNSMTASNDSASGTNDLPQVDPSRFIGRVAKAFQTAQDRGGTLQLRLSPPELGALRIELNVKDGVMSASLQTENANARRLLLDHLPALRDRLAEQNIRVDRFDVDVRDGSSGQSDTRGSQQQQFQHQPDQPAPRRPVQPQPRIGEIAAPERIAVGPIVGDTGLNLIV